MDKNGVLTLNAEGGTQIWDHVTSSVKITEFPIRETNVNAFQDTYVQPLLDTSEIVESEVAKPLNEYQLQCGCVQKAYQRDYYGLIGFTLLALSSTTAAPNYAPSITYMVKNGPSSVTFKNIPDKYKNKFYDREIKQTCDSKDAIDYLQFALQSGGTTSSNCFQNTEIPNSTNKCSNGDNVTVILKGFHIASYKQLKSNDIKELIIRFGAVQFGEYIAVGWRQQKWIAALKDASEYKYTGTEVDIDEGKQYNGLVVFNLGIFDVGVVEGEIDDDIVGKVNVRMIVGIVCGVMTFVIFVIIIVCCCCARRKSDSNYSAECCCCCRIKNSYNDTDPIWNQNSNVSDFPNGIQMHSVSQPQVNVTQTPQPISYPAVPSDCAVNSQKQVANNKDQQAV
ncbi:MAG: hypothetical protein EZS28_000377 [Streblomastix strix]|uniref:Uncharacterized protein n=1 Tax=Streblomastix strix TaxID=222440 RepID=A0A5J4XAE5_9EUKA|nr:MAG: hypothetical protein EZS28_000377 [Streblomastix strix]